LRVNNPNFANIKEFDECPSPILVEDENGDSNSLNSVFDSQPEFIDSLLKNKEPTFIFNSRNYHPDFRLTLPSLFPLHSHLDVEELKKIVGLMCQQRSVSNITLKYHYQDFNMLTLFW
jgi:hypothetical protein